jgi:hypothetical protein
MGCEPRSCSLESHHVFRVSKDAVELVRGRMRSSSTNSTHTVNNPQPTSPNGMIDQYVERKLYVGGA